METTSTTVPGHAGSRFARFVAGLDAAYERLHTAKEDAFWTAYMGLAPDPAAARAELDAREIELARFLRDPARLAAVRAEVEAAEAAIGGPTRGDAAAPAVETPSEAVMQSLAGWLATFEAHVIDDPA